MPPPPNASAIEMREGFRSNHGTTLYTVHAGHRSSACNSRCRRSSGIAILNEPSAQILVAAFPPGGAEPNVPICLRTFTNELTNV